MCVLLRMYDLDLDPMTLTLDLDLDVVKMCLPTPNEVSRLRLSKVKARTAETDRQTNREMQPNTLPRRIRGR